MPDARTELIEAVIFISLHVEVTVRLLVLLEVFDPLVERPRDVFLRRPIKAYCIEGRYALVGQLLPITGIFTRLSCFGAELGEEFVYG